MQVRIKQFLKILKNMDFFSPRQHRDLFVRRCYESILGRQVDPEGLRLYTSAISTGMPHYKVIESIMNSDEFKHTLKRPSLSQSDHSHSISREDIIMTFKAILGRIPNEEEVRDKLTHIHSQPHLRDQLLWSKEFKEISPSCSPSATDFTIWADVPYGYQIKVSLLDRAIGFSILRGDYEKDETDFIKKHVKPNDNVLDIGANIGYFSILMAGLVGKTGYVTSFEPLPCLYSLFEDSINRNHLNDKINLVKKVLSSQSGTVNLCAANYGETPNNGGAFISESTNHLPMGHTSHSCESITLDSLSFNKSISFIKIDVEGAEPLVMEGGSSFFRFHSPLILSEVHKGQLSKVSGCSSKDFLKLMDGYGYNAYRLDGGVGEQIFDTENEVENIIFKHR